MNSNPPQPKVYKDAVRALLSPDERQLFYKLSSPKKIQDFLDRIPINFVQTHRSPRFSLQRGSVQCIEGALIAAAAFAYHGKPPLLLDLRTTTDDDDHVVALFEERGLWGAVSKTNHAILRYRDPVYASVRELALSYFHEYALENGKKTLREFSEAFDLRTFAPERWVTAQENLWWLAEALDDSPHRTILPNDMRTQELRATSPIERQALKIREWKRTPRIKKLPQS